MAPRYHTFWNGSIKYHGQGPNPCPEVIDLEGAVFHSSCQNSWHLSPYVQISRCTCLLCSQNLEWDLNSWNPIAQGSYLWFLAAMASCTPFHSGGCIHDNTPPWVKFYAENEGEGLLLHHLPQTIKLLTLTLALFDLNMEISRASQHVHDATDESLCVADAHKLIYTRASCRNDPPIGV